MLRYFILFIGLFVAVQTNAQQVKIDVTGRKCAADNQCGGDSANFKALMTGFTAKDVKTWSWNFGEPTSGRNNTSAKQDPRHLYQSRGDYKVVLTTTLNSGAILKDTATVSIFPLPPPVQFFGGKSDTTICESERGKLILDPYKDFGSPPASLKLKYSWYPNYGADTNRIIKVDSSGCHSVTVTDSLTGCVVSARIDVKICAEQLPPPKQYWYFGNGAGIEFPQGGDPSAITNGKINTPEGTSVFTDKKGKLQFYTDGVTVFDKNGKPMRIKDRKNPADTLLAGNKNATQAAIIVQQPGCKSCEFIYYIFTTQDINDSTHVLSYSIVDMRLNGGKGEVTALNIPLYSPSTERITAVKNTKDSSYYIVTHDYKSGTIRSFNLTKQGISPGKTYPIGTPQNTPSSGEGQMKISNNGKKLGVLIPGPPNNLLELYNYTDSTGAITDRITINLGPAPPKAYGVEFSGDGKKVYVTMQGDSAKGIASLILQYDFSSGDSLTITESRQTIDSSMTAFYGALQFTEDKIYVAIKGKTSLGVINNPDGITKKGVDYQEKGLDLKGKTSQLGLPNLVANEQPDNSSPSISASETCDGETTDFKAGPWCEKRNETYRWNFDYKGPDLEQLPRIPGVQFPYASVIASLGGFGQAAKSPNASYKYPKPGTYRVAMYLRNDCKDTLLISTVTVTPMPKAALGRDIELCQNSTKLDIGDRNPDSEYYWLLNNRIVARGTNPILTVTKSGTYTGVAIIGECVATDTIKVKLNKPTPLAIPNSALNICIGTSVTLNAGFGFIDYKWSNGANTQVISVDKPGKYKLIATDRNDCQSTDSVTITLKPKANWTSQINPTKTCGDATGSIKLVDLNPASSTYSFKWFKNGIDLNITNPEALGLGIGNYTVNVSSPATCDTSANYAINALTPPINLQATGGVPASCDLLNDGVVRIAIFNTAAVPDTYSLTKVGDPSFERKGLYSEILLPFSTTIAGAIKGLAPGTYNLILADKAGCQLAQSGVIVGVLPSELVDLGANKILCQGQETILDAGTTGNNYLWSTGEKTQTIKVKTSGDYRVTVSKTSSPACISSSKLTVKVNPIPTVTTGTPLTACGNAAPINLSASPSGGEWTGNAITKAGLFTPAPTLAGQQTLTYTVTQNGCEGKGTKTINILPSPPQNLLPPDDFWCEETPKRINAPEIPGATYRWSSGETTQFIQPNASGKYILTVNLATCQSKDTITITIAQNPKLFNVKTDLSLCVIEGAVATLDPGEAKGWTYSWQPRGEKTRKILVDKVGTYTVTVKNAEGCPTVQPIVVENKCEPRIVVPEIFTPNGDGVNDAMDVFVAHISDFEIKVYNRWGEVVFVSDDPNLKWDGRYRELFYPTQSYAWVVTYRSLYFPERPQGTKRGAVVVAK